MTKSGFMVGLGETADEVEQLLRDLREQDVDVATIGQYLQPTRRNLPVTEYVTPEQFERYRDFGLSLGFKMVFSGPLVRSSYMADVVSEQAATARDSELDSGPCVLRAARLAVSRASVLSGSRLSRSRRC